jgi:predicted PurR-regulated permease PerM
MNLFEKRPLNCFGKVELCQRKDPSELGFFYDEAAAEAGKPPHRQIKMKTLYECVFLFKVPHVLSVLLVLGLVIGTLVGILMMLGSEMSKFLSDPSVEAEMEQLEQDWDNFLNESGIIIIPDPGSHEGYYWSEIVEYLGVVSVYLNFAVMVFLFLIYLMVEKDADEKMFQGDSAAIEEIESMIEHYIQLKTLLSIGTGAIVAIILMIIGIQLAVLFGVMTFLLNFIPNIGSMIAMFLPLPVVLLDSSLETWQQVAAFVGPGCVQGYVGNILEPQVFGKSLNMTALSILGALVVWGSIWGITGAVLSVPLLGLVKILCHHTNHPLAKYCLMLIREDPTLDEEAERHGGLQKNEDGDGDDNKDEDEGDDIENSGGDKDDDDE